MKKLLAYVIGCWCALAQADRVISANLTLEADADWRSDGTVTIAEGAIVSLNGHALALAGLAGTGSIVGGRDLVQNGGFETFTGSPNSWAYCHASGAPQPTGWTWDYEVPTDFGIGLTTQNNIWLSVPPADGARACFIQGYVAVSQTVTVPQAGDYTLSFAAVGRVGFNNLLVEACMDDTVVASVDCAASDQFVTTTVTVTLTAGTHVLAFRGAANGTTGVPDNYRCGCIDAVSLRAQGAAVVMDELTLEIPAGQSVTNSGVRLAGDLSLTKTGAGELVLACLAQSYAGLTQIAAGTVKVDALDTSWQGTLFGKQSRVIVGAGACLDLATYSNAPRELVLAGGELAGSISPTTVLPCLTSVELTADSTISGTGVFLVRAGYAATSLKMNDHTLNLNIGASGIFVFCNTDVSGGGRIVVDGGGTLQLGQLANLAAELSEAGLSGQIGVRAAGTDLEVRNASLRVYTAPSMFKDYASAYTGSLDEMTTDGILKIFGTFVPAARWHACELQSGATLDLRAIPGVWTNRCTFADAARAVTCADAATVTVNLAGRTLASGDLLVRGLDFAGDGTTFVCDAETAQAGGTLGVSSLGVFYGAPSDLVATATWTGAAGNGRVDDPANWTCRNLAGAIVPSGVPGADTVVDLKGSLNFAMAARYGFIRLGDSALTGDCDLRACGTDVSIDGTVDLQGHHLFVSTLDGAGCVTDTTAATGANCLVNGSFETVVGGLSHGSWGYFYLTQLDQATGWLSSGNNGGNASPGLGTSNHNVWFSGAAPEGNVAAFLQGHCTLTQTFTAPATGTYLFSFAYTGRPGYNNLRINFEFDDQALVFVDTPNTTFANAIFGIYLTAGEHVLTIRGDPRTKTNPNNRCACIDDLRLCAVTPGTLTVEVPAGTTLANEVELAGNLALEKTGAGTFAATRTTQSYTGGTIVQEGTFQAAFYDLGFAGAAYGLNPRMFVASGATFDLNGQANAPALVALAGGTVLNEVQRAHFQNPQLINVDLLADSTLRGAGFGFLRQEFNATTCHMNGHTLTLDMLSVDGYQGYQILFVNTTITGGGTLYAQGEGTLLLGWNNSGASEPVSAPDTSLVVGPRVALSTENATFTFGDYFAQATVETDADKTNGSFKVTRRFQPGTRWHRCELQDGATLDLNAVEGTWTNACVFASEANLPRVASFAAGAKICVDMSARAQIPADGVLTAWAEPPAEGVTFTLDATSRRRGRYLIVRADGLHVGSGSIVFIR